MSRPLTNKGSRLSFDIFCRAIDNYGDIGVCWRLARQLAQAPFNHTTRLWVDDLARFNHLEKSIDPAKAQQHHAGVDVVHWTTDAPRLTPHNVVIEAFACTPPAAFINAMIARDSLWLNLEYLSAESWVEGFHRQPSIQANGLRKYFFFPGFTAGTGGLLREPGLTDRRNHWQASPKSRTTLLQRCGLSVDDLRLVDHGARLIFLFCYPDAPVDSLIDALSALPDPSLILIPEGILPTLGLSTALVSSEHTATSQAAKVHLRQIPFVDQDDFDALLWSCDLNIVRGEDSLVRALWAARPMIWQPYRQEENAHVIKLKAWLDRSTLHPDTKSLIQSWTEHDLLGFRQQLLDHQQPATWSRWQTQSRQWSEQLSQQTDLASALVQFCAQQLRTG